MAPALESGSNLELEPLDLVAGLAVEREGQAELERADVTDKVLKTLDSTK